MKNIPDYSQGKTELAAWMVGNCGAQPRMALVQNLKNTLWQHYARISLTLRKCSLCSQGMVIVHLSVDSSRKDILQTYQAGIFCACFVIAIKISGRTRIHFLSDLPSHHCPRKLLRAGTAIRLTSHSRVTVVTSINFLPTNIRRSSKVKVLRITKIDSLRSTRQEMGARKNGRARGIHAGERERRHGRPSKIARALFLAPIYFLSPATQATKLITKGRML